MRRLLDLTLTLLLTLLLSLPMLLVALAVRITSQGPVLFWSNRVGQNNRFFKMPKFRSMKVGTPTVASHLLQAPSCWMTPIGSFLRKSSLDEFPQLWSVLLGDMSLVGPRPALFNQKDLIALRTELGIHALKPGLTGWAQVNGRDDISIIQKIQYDFEYMKRQSLMFDCYILILTIKKIIISSGVSH